MTVGKSGVKNSALFAAAILALNDPVIAGKLQAFRQEQSDNVRAADAEVSNLYLRGCFYA